MPDSWAGSKRMKTQLLPSLAVWGCKWLGIDMSSRGGWTSTLCGICRAALFDTQIIWSQNQCVAWTHFWHIESDKRCLNERELSSGFGAARRFLSLAITEFFVVREGWAQAKISQNTSKNFLNSAMFACFSVPPFPGYAICWLWRPDQSHTNEPDGGKPHSGKSSGHTCLTCCLSLP